MSERPPLPRRSESVEVAEFDAEFVVFDPRVNRVHHVRELGAVVWDACDGRTDLEQLITEMRDVLGAEPEHLRAEVSSAVALFEAEGLLEGSEPPEEPPPCLGCGNGQHPVLPTTRRWGHRWWRRR
ncbi:MAG: PqqD family protein [Ilumatobacteraceae bacterium]